MSIREKAQPLLAWLLFVLSTPFLMASASDAQETGAVAGTIFRVDLNTPLPGAAVQIAGSPLSVVTDQDGQYVLPAVPVGEQTLLVSMLGFRAVERAVSVITNGQVTVDQVLEQIPITLSNIVVEAVSRTREPVLVAPAAVSVVDPTVARDLSSTGQAPLAFSLLAGMDVVQNDAHDFNVNTRGFNASFNRRLLVLQDGRDLSIAFLGSQEWNALAIPLEDLGQIELIRGPGSALYGANAYSGVLSITTPTAREVVGTKVMLAGGELGTLRADIRHASVFGDRRFGYRVNAGYYRSDSFSVSRTGAGDLEAEYGDIVDTDKYPVNTPLPGFEIVPLSGQENSGPGTPSTGDVDPLVNIYGSARFDYYSAGGDVLTAEAGGAQVENEILVSAIGRVQFERAVRPWARLAWNSPEFRATAWYSGRSTLDPQVALGAGTTFEEVSRILHTEAQYNRLLFSDAGGLVFGGSIRESFIDSKQTLIPANNDARSDLYYSLFGQFGYAITRQFRVVAAARVDGGDLFDSQFSPRGALVYSPSQDHAVRLTVNRAFQTPSTIEFFVRFPAGLPVDLTAIESALRTGPLGADLAGVPMGELFTTTSAVPQLVLGNENLAVEKVTSVELGYKGQFADRFSFAVNGYRSRLTDFVTNLLPGANPTFGPWTAPSTVPEGARASVEQAVGAELVGTGNLFAAAGLTRIPGDTTAIVVSLGNAGTVRVLGFELEGAFRLTDELHVEANYGYVDFDIDETSLLAGDQLSPNTPRHRGNLSVSYAGRQGLDVRVAAQFVGHLDWASGVFFGRIPPRQTVQLSTGYLVTDNVRFHITATNLLDQRHYQVYGGSVIGRRVLGGATVRF